MAKVKTISMAEAVSKLESNPAMQAALAEIKRKREVSPARHNRQFNLELMNIGMELNGRCQQISYLTEVVLDSKYPNEDRDEAYKLRTKEIFIVAKLQQKHDDLVRELDLAIHNEDALKHINKVS
jgi:hypothetical protein